MPSILIVVEYQQDNKAKNSHYREPDHEFKHKLYPLDKIVSNITKAICFKRYKIIWKSMIALELSVSGKTADFRA